MPFCTIARFDILIMAVTQFAPVNPSVLSWALEDSGWALDEMAHKLSVSADRLAAWVNGERQPTVRQAQNLAKVLHRPLSVLFMPSPPELPPLAAEYRRLPTVQPGAESPQLRLALRQMISRREAALDLMAELGVAVPEFKLSAHLNEAPAAVGQRLREALGISVADQLGWANEWQAWRSWRTAAESAGFLVFQFSKVGLEEVRGLSLLHMPMPVIGINAKERVPEAKIFTSLHEAVHLMLAAGQEEKPAIQEDRTNGQWLELERYAEVAASHAMVPEAALQEQARGMVQEGAAWSLQDVRRLARRFRMTALAMATRLRESGFMSWDHYHAWRREWDAYVQTLPVRAGGFATPAEKSFNRVGRPFVQLVLEAMATNRITSVDAARYLDLKFDHFEQLRTIVSSPMGAVAENG